MRFDTRPPTESEVERVNSRSDAEVRRSILEVGVFMTAALLQSWLDQLQRVRRLTADEVRMRTLAHQYTEEDRVVAPGRDYWIASGMVAGDVLGATRGIVGPPPFDGDLD